MHTCISSTLDRNNAFNWPSVCVVRQLLGSCLTTLCHNTDDQRHRSSVSRLDTTRVRAMAEFCKAVHVFSNLVLQ